MSPMASTTLITRLRRFPAMNAQLRMCARPGELFAHAAGMALREGGFERAVLLTAAHRQLTALDIDALADAPSDQLRRKVLSSPVPLRSGTEEAELVRRGDVALTRPRAATEASVLAEQLGLREHAYGPVVADGKTLAVLVVDREAPPVDEEERLWVDLFATVVAVALTDLVMRVRIAEISAELRHFTASATALVREAAEGSVALPSTGGAGPSLARIGMGGETGDVDEMFSERELRVAELLVAGKSNRQIAEELVVSPETVKTHVKRILRKLGAHNRAEAVGLFLRLRER